ncbi:MAG TPA: hypothetical protein DCO82_05265 [Alphaproteobacteria bacterium]|nr:hypothetical protein [Alphaproteobacteria bacterium]
MNALQVLCPIGRGRNGAQYAIILLQVKKCFSKKLLYFNKIKIRYYFTSCRALQAGPRDLARSRALTVRANMHRLLPAAPQIQDRTMPIIEG